MSDCRQAYEQRYAPTKWVKRGPEIEHGNMKERRDAWRCGGRKGWMHVAPRTRFFESKREKMEECGVNAQ